jgi:hypothetical protein
MVAAGGLARVTRVVADEETDVVVDETVTGLWAVLAVLPAELVVAGCDRGCGLVATRVRAGLGEVLPVVGAGAGASVCVGRVASTSAAGACSTLVGGGLVGSGVEEGCVSVGSGAA